MKFCRVQIHVNTQIFVRINLEKFYCIKLYMKSLADTSGNLKRVKGIANSVDGNSS